MEHIERRNSEEQAPFSSGHLWTCCVPDSLVTISGHNVSMLAFGCDHSLFLTKEGLVYSFGKGESGQLGLGSTDDHLKEPCLISYFENKRIISLACGPRHSAAISDNGDIYMWGDNTYGQCGTTDKKMLLLPVNIQLNGAEVICARCNVVSCKKTNIIEVSCGETHTLALSQTSELWTWGEGLQLGLTNLNKTLPKRHNFFENHKVLSIACGYAHSIVVVEAPKSSNVENNLSEDEKVFICSSCKTPDHTKAVKSIDYTCPLGLPLDKEQLAIPETIKSDESENSEKLFDGTSKLQISEDNARSSEVKSLRELAELSLCVNSDENQSISSCSEVKSSSEFKNSSEIEKLSHLCLAAIPSDVRRELTPECLDNYSKLQEDSHPLNTEEAYFTNEEGPLEVTGEVVTENDKTNIVVEDGVEVQIREKNDDSSDAPNRSRTSSSSIIDHQSAREFLNRHLFEFSLTSAKSKLNFGTVETSEYSCDEEKSQVDRMALVKRIVSKVRTTVVRLPSFTYKINESNDGSSSSQESFTVLEAESALSPQGNENLVMRRTGSMKSLIEIRHSQRQKDVDRKGSLESLMSKASQKEKNMGKSCHSQRKMENGYACFQTEVWTWGKGSNGVLGHGDEIDRLQPCCVSNLSGHGVIRVVAGANHSLALTSDCRVFSWGLNDNGQLGHSMGSLIILSPKLADLPPHHLVWDVAAGTTHTVLLADIRAPHVALYYAGFHEKECESQLSVCLKNKNIQQLNILKKTGLIMKIFAGGPYSGCVVEQQGVGEIPITHEFAASERRYFLQLQIFIRKLLKLFLKEGILSEVLAIFSDAMKTLIAHFSELLDMVSMNAYDLTLLVQEKGNIDSLYILDSEEEWLEMYLKYGESLCNLIASNSLVECVKVLGLSPLTVKTVARDVLGESNVESKGTCDILQYLLNIPIKRISDYVCLFSRMAAVSPKILQGKDILKTAARWRQLCETINKEVQLAEKTKAFWNGAPQKVVETYRTLNRRFIRDSRNNPISLCSSGRFTTHWFILFNDIFVHSLFGGFQKYSLQTVWIEAVSDANNSQNLLILTSPEDILTLTCPTSNEKTEWVCSFNQAIRKTLDGNKHLEDVIKNTNSKQRLSPPLSRHASYTFTKNPQYKDACYTGLWLCGKLHGHGEMVWSDGKKYVGSFKHNLHNGEGVYMVPSEDKFVVYEGTWKDGKMNGLGIVRYPSGDIYKGCFKNGTRHGHGVMKLGQFLSSAASLYIGEWANNARQGYGVMDDILTGEKYMGMWSLDSRHGNGTVVTIDGIYYEGTFLMDRLSGFGVMIFEDNTCFEGELGAGGMLNGKGTLHLSNGDSIDGCFNGKWSDGIKINGMYHKAPSSPTSLSELLDKKQERMSTLNQFSVPADEKWTDIFSYFQELMGLQGLNISQDNERAWEAVAVAINKRKSEIQAKKKWFSYQDNLDMMERIPCTSREQGHLWLNEYSEIQNYLSMACECPFHPLGQLVERLVDVYRTTYLGIGAHSRLLPHAVDEIHSFVKRMYSVIRILFPDLPDENNPTIILSKEKAEKLNDNPSEGNRELDDIDAESEVVTPSGLLHPILLPRLYPPLFTLYVLSHQNEDKQYLERLDKWNKQSDIALMNFLGVDQKFWLYGEDIFGQSRRSFSNIKDEYFLSAIEALQHISTTFTAQEKLKIVHQTFDEVNKEVQRKFGSDFLWTMDDLFPVFQYVVVRAHIPHLGSEIHLIEDLMEAHLQHGELGIMFTTLKACYFQIRTEKLTQL